MFPLPSIFSVVPEEGLIALILWSIFLGSVQVPSLSSFRELGPPGSDLLWLRIMFLVAQICYRAAGRTQASSQSVSDLTPESTTRYVILSHAITLVLHLATVPLINIIENSSRNMHFLTEHILCPWGTILSSSVAFSHLICTPTLGSKQNQSHF